MTAAMAIARLWCWKLLLDERRMRRELAAGEVTARAQNARIAALEARYDAQTTELEDLDRSLAHIQERESRARAELAEVQRWIIEHADERTIH